MTKKQVAYLVLRSDGAMRIAKKPRIAGDEVAIRLNLSFPAGWGSVIADLDIDVPDFVPEVTYEQAELDLT